MWTKESSAIFFNFYALSTILRVTAFHKGADLNSIKLGFGNSIHFVQISYYKVA